MRALRRKLLPLLLALPALAAGAAAAAATPAHAARVKPCIHGTDGPLCTFVRGRVAYVDDGDTLHVRVGRRRHRHVEHVRLAGIQAMERGECGADLATERFEELVEEAHGRVRLGAQDESSESRGRPVRSVDVRIGRHWRNVGRTLAHEGLVLWMPNAHEWAWNARYSILTQRAADAGIGLWSGHTCGDGPSPAATLQVAVNYDADGRDGHNVNGEFVRISNPDLLQAVPLDGWWLRDSALRRYTFPPGTIVPAGGTLTVHVGEGLDTATDLFWGLGRPVFGNVRPHRATGDGAYLFDPLGNLRAWSVYPCRLDCTDPGDGALVLSAKPRGREFVLVHNRGDQPVALDDFRLIHHARVYPFPVGSELFPGGTIKVMTRGNPRRDRQHLKHWHAGHSILRNRGGAVHLKTFANASAACVAWGDGHC